MSQLALYTTIYPGVERYLPVWYESVVAQTDTNFDIWIGVDELTVERVKEVVGGSLSARWVIAEEGNSPAQIREKAIARMVDEYSIVVFVDSDDVLEPTRVEAARKSLQESDVSGCAMRIVDKDGNDTGITFEPPTGVKLTKMLPRVNVFGLSNTAYRSQILRQCLPIPADCVLVDWFLITCAWTRGANLVFDNVPRMAYRQHAQNIARILPPFTQRQVLTAAELVLEHYACVLNHIPELQPQHRVEIEDACGRVEMFYASLQKSADRLRQYVDALNHMPPKHVWWSYVAHPELEEIWKN